MKKIAVLIFVSSFLLSCSSYQNNGIYNPTRANTSYDEMKEFAELMKQDSVNRKERAEAVNLFLAETSSDKRSAILFKNNSSCNIIIRISGNGKNERLPVPKNDINYIVLEKGTYTFQSKLCNSKYQSTKTLSSSIDVTLSEN